MWWVPWSSAVAGVVLEPRSRAPLLVPTADPLTQGLLHAAAVRGAGGPVQAGIVRSGICCAPDAVVVRDAGGSWEGVFLGPDGEALGLVEPWYGTAFRGGTSHVLPTGPTPATALRSAHRWLAPLAGEDDVLVAAPGPGGFDVWAVRASPDVWTVVASAHVDLAGAVSAVQPSDGTWVPRVGASAASLGALGREGTREAGLWSYRPFPPPDPPEECPPPPPETCRQPR